MPDSADFRTLILSVVKHDYIARAVAAHPRFNLVAVADDASQPEWIHSRNQEFADRFEISYIRDPETAIATMKPQVAVVSSEAERHCDLAIRAARCGLHVIVDKPMSTRLSDCEQLVQAVEAANVRCLVWNRSQLPAVVHAKETIDSGAIGDIRAIHCDFYFSKDAGPPKGTRRPGDPPINWLERQKEAHVDGSDGGVGVEPMGELQVEGIYPLAYIRMLTGGRRVERVFARTAAHFHQAHVDNDVDDLASVTLELEGGIIGSLCIGRIGAASHPDLGEIRLHVVGTQGALVINEARPEVSIHYRDQPSAEFRSLRLDDDSDFQLVDGFAHAIDAGTTTMLDAAAGRDLCAVVTACVDSGRSGKPETVDY